MMKTPYENGSELGGPLVFEWEDDNFHFHQLLARESLLKAMWDTYSVTRDGKEGHVCVMGPGKIAIGHVATKYAVPQNGGRPFFSRDFNVYTYRSGTIDHLHGQIATYGAGLESDVAQLPTMITLEAGELTLQAMPYQNEVMIYRSDGMHQVPQDLSPDTMISNTIEGLNGVAIKPYEILFRRMTDDELILWYARSNQLEMDTREWTIMGDERGEKYVLDIEPDDPIAWANGDHTDASVRRSLYQNKKT